MTPYERLRTIIESIAHAQPELPARELVPLILEVEERMAQDAQFVIPEATASLQARGEWVLRQPEIMENAFERKINAIKDCRMTTGWGLKEAKEAVEMAVQMSRSRGGVL